MRQREWCGVLHDPTLRSFVPDRAPDRSPFFLRRRAALTRARSKAVVTVGDAAVINSVTSTACAVQAGGDGEQPLRAWTRSPNGYSGRTQAPLAVRSPSAPGLPRRISSITSSTRSFASFLALSQAVTA